MTDTPKLPSNLDEMLRTPGVYQISVKGSPFFTRVEVDSNLVCYQLTPNLFRDGILPRDGWRREDVGYDIAWVAKL